MAPLLVIGIGIGLLITAAVPADAASGVMEGRGAFAVPIAAALGTPLYFSTELFVPIADSLTIAGVSTGAVVALTISGAGANLPEFVILGRLFDRRVLAVFVVYVFAVAVVGGGLATVVDESLASTSAGKRPSQLGFGLSPGDNLHEEPYVYVNPYPGPPETDPWRLPEGWHWQFAIQAIPYVPLPEIEAYQPVE